MTPQEVYNKCLKEKRRIPELEGIISKDPMYSYYYSLNIIGGPWKKGERIIRTDSYFAFTYARDIIKGHWEKGEDIISIDAAWSYHYSILVVKGPFEKCHPIIFNSRYKDDYINFLKLIKYDYSEWLI